MALLVVDLKAERAIPGKKKRTRKGLRVWKTGGGGINGEQGEASEWKKVGFLRGIRGDPDGFFCWRWDR